MNASEPEADTEYSSRPGPARRSGAPSAGPATGSRRAAAGAVLLGAVLLCAAEFVPLLHVRTTGYHGGLIATVPAGAHHSYALIPVAVLSVLLAAFARASGNRTPFAGIAVLALAALGIALVGDLPDVHSAGLVIRGGTTELAGSSAGPALYLETLGAVVLLLGAAAGLLLGLRAPQRSAS